MFIISYMSFVDTGAESAVESRWLVALGKRLRSARRDIRVSATAAAQAAGVSRVTWHRMEAGSPSVSAGAYARALDVLGIGDFPPTSPASERPRATIPVRIRIGDWPELTALAWSLQPDTLLTPREALAVYEREARHLDQATLTEGEQTLIENLRLALADDVHP